MATSRSSIRYRLDAGIIASYKMQFQIGFMVFKEIPVSHWRQETTIDSCNRDVMVCSKV